MLFWAGLFARSLAKKMPSGGEEEVEDTGQRLIKQRYYLTSLRLLL